MAFTDDYTIRAKIAEVITLATEGKANVYPWWKLGFTEENKWPALLLSDADVDPKTGEQRVHGYVITRPDIYPIDINARCPRYKYIYLILGLHYFWDGTEADNSDRRVTTEMDAITAALIDERVIADTVISRVDPPTWTHNIKPLGDLMHIVTATLPVEPCRTEGV